MKADAKFVRNARKQLALSQPAFGKLLGVSKRTIVRWEAGDTSPTQLERIAITSLVEQPRAELPR